MGSYSDDESESYSDSSDSDSNNNKKNKLMRQIEQLEEENIGTKHWSLMGEATANKRPKNSLLEMDVSFQHATRVQDVEEKTEKFETLEDLIKQRIFEVIIIIIIIIIINNDDDTFSFRPLLMMLFVKIQLM